MGNAQGDQTNQQQFPFGNQQGNQGDQVNQQQFPFGSPQDNQVNQQGNQTNQQQFPLGSPQGNQANQQFPFASPQGQQLNQQTVFVSSASQQQQTGTGGMYQPQMYGQPQIWGVPFYQYGAYQPINPQVFLFLILILRPNQFKILVEIFGLYHSKEKTLLLKFKFQVIRL